MPSVVGRPASVLAEGETFEAVGGGGWYVDKEWLQDDPDTPQVERDPERSTSGFVYKHYSRTVGLGRGLEAHSGLNNIQFFGDIRYQVLGVPTGEVRDGEIHRSPIDFSLEIGSSITPVPLVNFIIHEIHVGASISKAMGPWTPYFALRHHWGTYHTLGGEDHSFLENFLFFEQQMIFTGVQFTRRDGRRISLELFHGRPPPPDPISTEGNLRTWGLNLVFMKRPPAEEP